MSIIVTQEARIVSIKLNRPLVLNAINQQMMDEIITTVKTFDSDPNVGCFVLKGDDKAFAAGADIKELEKNSWHTMSQQDVFSQWEGFTGSRTPKIAAVSGFALGGGCELAMMCDIIYASESAVFGQPEIKLGVTPGMGGSQRLTRLIGRTKAMDMILTGRTMDAKEAYDTGLVARLFKEDVFFNEVMKIAHHIASFSKIASSIACESINRADEVNLREGLLSERRSYHSLWNTEDQSIGMEAFINKQTPVFTNR